MLTLTDSQVDLLAAMTSTVTAQIAGGLVWIERRPYPAADLQVLRAAKLVRPAESRLGAHLRNRFELTDLGMAEARRRTLPHTPTPEHEAATVAPIPPRHGR